MAAALKRLSDFAGGTCASVGPVYHLIHSCSLAQHLTNCCLDLCNALRGLVAALAGLGASQELQEDLGQLLSQLERGLHCTYNESQHQLLLELQVQVRFQHACNCSMGAEDNIRHTGVGRFMLLHVLKHVQAVVAQLSWAQLAVLRAVHGLLCRLRLCAAARQTHPPCQPSSRSRCCSTAAWRSLPLTWLTCNRQPRSSSSLATMWHLHPTSSWLAYARWVVR